MKTMEKLFISVLSVALIVLCFACEDKSQIKLPDSKTSQEKASLPAADLSKWQTVLLKEKGIKFKLPPDWQHDDSDLESKNENFNMAAMEWNTPNKEMIRIFVTTYHKGFVSLAGNAASTAELLEEEFNRVTQNTKSDASVSEVKKLKLSGVEGVFSILHVEFEDKDIGVRRGINWTGYRMYQGKGQKIEISLSANPKSEEVLRTIFSTIEFEYGHSTIGFPQKVIHLTRIRTGSGPGSPRGQPAWGGGSDRVAPDPRGRDLTVFAA